MVYNPIFVHLKAALAVMGQSASTQREEFLHRDSRRLSQLLQDRNSRNGTTSRFWTPGQQATDQPVPAPSLASSPPQDSHSSQPIATFSRQISTQSIPVLRGGAGNSRDISTRDDVFYEQHEERPPAHMEDLGVRDGQITHITASPMPRRSSRISNRFSSLVMPRYSTSETPGDSEQDHGEGRSWRRRLSNTEPLGTTPENQAHSSRRLSIFGSLSPRFSAAPRPRRTRERAPISRPFPLTPDGSLPPSGFTASTLREALPTRPISTDNPTSPSRFRSIRDSSRLSRVRRSISSPFEAFLPTSQRAQDPIDEIIPPPPRPQRRTPTHDADFRLSSLDVTDPSIDVGSELDPAPSANRESRFSVIPTVSESPERAVSRAEGPSWTERWSERGSVGRREGRRMPNMLRGRSSRLIRRENEGPLPRILHLAATAIAAQLSGTPEQPVPDMQSIGPDDLDGSLQNLFRTLQNASNLTGDGRAHDDDDPARPAGALPPLNFLRVFRFVSQGSNNAASQTERPSRARAEDQAAGNEDTPEDPDGRTVTLVVVGVRSVPSDRIGHEDTAALEPSLDSLLNLPALAPSTNALRNGTGSLLRHANGRSRFSHRRRASIPGLTTFPANYDSQRHQRTLSTSSRQGSGNATPVTGSATPLVISESPPGPHPPPSTPAEPALSAYSSAATTPSRRPSSASAIQQPPIPSRDAATQHLREAGILASDERGDQTSRVQQRRRSDSEFARHRDLGAGAARRNGVVEPDEVDTGDAPASGSRSWLIYVVGTNLSEDHPALTTPSLFTDVSCPFLAFSNVSTSRY